ncbi:dihydroxyacetone phosphate acyltransferase [Sitophilus oryzae]|uniref:Dihydroxyacetone phosphate acyltransferase n=1 Tax=Sitophilus oryzae TaxID=7048 RepID=A0A6J2YJN5_SITOR|nr:dihydroxyacetone phosphate acyltransferase [Sitophilus oryzae]
MTLYQKEYEDILSARRAEFSNWFWASRQLNIKYPVVINPKPTPESHKYAVLKSLKIRNLIEEISQRKNVNKKDIENDVRQILDEIGYKKNMKIIRWLALVLTKICLRVCTGIYVNYEGVAELKNRMGDCPVIYVPSHRSYADFILFSYICFTFDLEIPAIAAAMDFHGMMGMGEMLRNTGAFYIKRASNSDPIYWPTFKEYIYQLVANGDEPIEFFIEGTRSRSNKSLAPKYGLIMMILKAFFLGQVPDILFVPVSINYDRILEESLFSFELLGIPKPKESTSGFFKSLKIIKENFGNMYIHFDKPISIREYFGAKLDRTAHSFGPLHIQEITEEEKAYIPPLAHEIVQRQQKSTVLSCFNLVSWVMNYNLTKGNKFISRKELVFEMNALKEILQEWGARIFITDIQNDINECLKVHSNLIYEIDDRIGLVENKIVVGPVNPNKLKGHSLTEDTIAYSVPFVMLQIYVNPVLHYLVDAALIVIILRSPGTMKKDDLFVHFRTLRSIFCLEFVLLESWCKMNFEEALLRLIEQKVVTVNNNEYSIFEQNYLEEVLISSIQPFILAYFIVTEVLQKTLEQISEKALLANFQRLLEDAISEKKIFIHPYCMTLDTLGNCLNSLTNKKMLHKTRHDGQYVYEVDRGRILRLRKELEMYIPSFRVIKNFEIFSHIRSKI